MFVPLREVQGLGGTRQAHDRSSEGAADGLGDIRSELKQEAAAAGRGLIQQAAKYAGKKITPKGKAPAMTAAPKKKKGLPPLAWGGIILGGALLVGLVVRGGRGRRAAA